MQTTTLFQDAIEGQHKGCIEIFYPFQGLCVETTVLYRSVADPGSLSRIPDSNFFHPGSASKNLSILTPEKVFEALRNMIRIVHPGTGSVS